MSNILNTAEIVSTLTSLNPKLTYISNNTTNYVTKLQTIVDSHNTGETESKKLGSLARMLDYEIRVYSTIKEGIQQFIAANNKFIAECQKIESGEAVINEDVLQDSVTAFNNSISSVLALLASSTFAGDEQLQYRADDLKFGQSQMQKKLQQFQELKANTNNIYDSAIATIEDALGAQQQLNKCAFDKSKGKYSIPKDAKNWMNYLRMSEAQKEIVRKGYLTKGGKITDKGYDYLEKLSTTKKDDLSKEELYYGSTLLAEVNSNEELEKVLEIAYCVRGKTGKTAFGGSRYDYVDYEVSESFILLQQLAEYRLEQTAQAYGAFPESQDEDITSAYGFNWEDLWYEYDKSMCYQKSLAATLAGLKTVRKVDGSSYGISDYDPFGQFKVEYEISEDEDDNLCGVPVISVTHGADCVLDYLHWGSGTSAKFSQEQADITKKNNERLANIMKDLVLTYGSKALFAGLGSLDDIGEIGDAISKTWSYSKPVASKIIDSYYDENSELLDLSNDKNVMDIAEKFGLNVYEMRPGTGIYKSSGMDISYSNITQAEINDFNLSLTEINTEGQAKMNIPENFKGKIRYVKNYIKKSGLSDYLYVDGNYIKVREGKSLSTITYDDFNTNYKYVANLYQILAYAGVSMK